MANLEQLPDDLKGRICWGYFAERGEVFYIDGVDGTLAYIGKTIPSVERLRIMVAHADSEYKKLIMEHTVPERVANSKVVLAQNATTISQYGFELWPTKQKFVNADRVWYKRVPSKFRCQDHLDSDLRIAVYEYDYTQRLDAIRYMMHLYACTVLGTYVTIDLHDIDLNSLDYIESRIVAMWELANI